MDLCFCILTNVVNVDVLHTASLVPVITHDSQQQVAKFGFESTHSPAVLVGKTSPNLSRVNSQN